MLFILGRYNNALKILMYFFVISFFTPLIEGATYNYYPTPTPTPTPTPIPIKPTLPNNCEIWFPMPMEDGLVVLIQIYDTSITEHDHDCDGVIDSYDPDVDKNGIVVVKDSITIKKGEAVYIDVLANDSDVDVGGFIDKDTLMIFSQTLHGALRVVNGKVHYLPDANYIGEDTFTYVVKDNDGMSSKPTSVIIYIKELNRPPIVQGESLKTKEDIPLFIKLVGSDIDHDRLIYKIIDKPLHGTLSGTAPNLTYVPHANYTGDDSFTFKVNDATVDSQEAIVFIEVTPVNDAPVAVDDNVTTQEKESIAIQPLINDYDLDGNISKLRIISITQPQFGEILLDNNSVYYAPKSKNETLDSLTYTIADEYNATSTATITIHIVPVNDAPIAFNQTVETNEEEIISFELNGTDPDGDDINYTLVHAEFVPEHGEISGTPPHMLYTPDKDFTGTDYLTFTVSDGEYESYVAVVSIIVNPLNDPPIADAGENYIGIKGDTIIFDASKSYDIDGEIISYEWRNGSEIFSTNQVFEKQMLNEGTFTITLVVTDDQNATDSDEKIITLNPCCDGCNYPDPTDTNPYN